MDNLAQTNIMEHLAPLGIKWKMWHHMGRNRQLCTTLKQMDNLVPHGKTGGKFGTIWKQVEQLVSLGNMDITWTI